MSRQNSRRILFAIIVLGLIWCCHYVWRSRISPYLTKQDDLEDEVEIQEQEEEPDLPRHFVAPADDEPALSGDLQKLLAQARRELQDEKLLDARETARSGLEQCEEFSDAWVEFAHVIDDVNKILMNGSAPAPEKKKYIVAKGDTLDKIKNKLNTTVEALQKLNGMRSSRSTIYPGNPLSYIDGTWSIKVSKKHFLLCLYLDDKLYRIFRISIGMHDRTPTGNFIVSQKQPRPVWTYEGKRIPYGDPRNVLGTHWIGLKATDEANLALRGYGIHGTTEPDTIGKPASLGCIRMLNEEVEELYNFIPSTFNKIPIKVVIVE